MDSKSEKKILDQLKVLNSCNGVNSIVRDKKRICCDARRGECKHYMWKECRHGGSR